MLRVQPGTSTVLAPSFLSWMWPCGAQMHGLWCEATEFWLYPHT